MAPSKKRGKGLSSAAAAAAAAQEWHVGDLVLAKVKGFPAWPAQVSKPEAFGRHHNPTRVFVVFFGTKQIRFCHHSEISRFTPEARATLIAKTHSKCTPADLRLAVSEICDVAEQKNRVNDGGFTYNDSSVPGLNGRNEVDFAELLEDAEGDAINSDHRNSEDGGVVSGNDDQDDNDADQPVDSFKHAGNLSLLCQGVDQSVTKMKDHWRNFKVHEESGNDATSEIEEFDVDAGWASPGSNIDSSSLDGNSDDGTNQASKGIVILEKVQTNFASHEELDSFDNFDFFDEEVVNLPSSLQSEEKEKSVKPEKPAMIRNFNWSKQSSRTSAKSRKPAANLSRELPIKFCRKKRRQHTVKAPAPQVIVKDDKSDEDHEMAAIPEEVSGDSVGKESHEFTFRRKVTLKKRLRPPSFEQKFAGTDTGQDKGKRDTCSERSPIAHDPDDYLPIVKRARARAAKDAMFEKDQERKLENAPAQVRNADTAVGNGIDLEKGCGTATDVKLTVEEKCSVLKTTIVEGSLPPKAEKYRKRSSLADGEAALPPSKRLQRALEAMTACAAEAEAEEDEAEEEVPKADATVASATMCGEPVIKHTESSQALDVTHPPTARSSEMACALVASNVNAQPERLEVLASTPVFTKDPEVQVQAEKLEPLASPVHLKASPFSQIVHEVGASQSENPETIVVQKTSPEVRDTGEVQLEVEASSNGLNSSFVSPKIAEVKSAVEEQSEQLKRVETFIKVHEIGRFQSEAEKLEVRASSPPQLKHSPVFTEVHEGKSTVNENFETLEGMTTQKTLMSEDGSSVKAQRASSPLKLKYSSVSIKAHVDKSTIQADAGKMESMVKASPKVHEDGSIAKTQLVGASSPPKLNYTSLSTRILPKDNITVKADSILKASPKLHADGSSVKAEFENFEASPPKLKWSTVSKADPEKLESMVRASSKVHEDGSSVKSQLEVRASSPSRIKYSSTKVREDTTKGDSEKVETMVMRKASPKIHEGVSSVKAQEIRTLSPFNLKYSPVSPKAEDGSNVRTYSERLEGKIVRKASPKAREVVSSVKARPERLEVRAASPVTQRHSPVSPKVHEVGNTVKPQPEAASSPVTLKSSQVREVGNKAQSEKLGALTSPDTPKASQSREIGSSGKAPSEKADKPKITKMKKHSTNSPVTYGSKHGTDTSSLASERGTTDSHSGESLASESEHTSGRMKSESSSFRTKLGLHHGSTEVGRMNGSGKLDALDLSFISTTSRFQSEGEVNKVREAYEAAKELKQKLASKDGDTSSSTSMKYLIAAAQSKQIHPIQGSMLFPSTEMTTAPSTSPSVGPEANKTLMDADNEDSSQPSLAPGTSKSLSSAHISDGFMSPEAEAARNVFEGLLDVLSRAKESILRATRQAIDCAKLGLSEQVIDIIAKKLETEQSFPRRIDLFFLVDSITQSSHNLKGTPAGVYRSIVQTALPRLLSAAAPPGNFARENRRQCLKVFKLWHERGVFPPPVIRHFMHEIEMHNGERMVMSRRPARNERPVDDPIREMEGMQVDEYGSNASFSLPGLTIPRMFEDEEDINDGGRTGDLGASEVDVTADGVNATSHEPVERHPHVLEDVDGELEMEDVSPVSEVDTWSRQYVSPASILSGPPLPLCPPPTPPPLPSSPPPGTPPPPPPPSPPQDPAVPSAYQEGFCSVSPAYLQHVQNSSMQPPFNRPCDSYEQYNPAIYGCEDGYGMRMDGYNSYGLPGQLPGPGPLSPPYAGHHPYGHSFQVNNADFSYQPYGPPPVHPSEVGPWSEPSPRGMRDRFMPRIPDDPYYNPHQEPFHERYGEPGPPDFYHSNAPAPPFMPRQYEGGYGSGGLYHGYPSPDHPMKMGPGPGMGRRMPGPYSHGPYPSW